MFRQPNIQSLAADIGVELNDSEVKSLESAARKQGDCSDWRAWLKNRISERGFLTAGRCQCGEFGLHVVLHVFNIFRRDVLPSTGQFLMDSETARSRIITGVVKPRPIDRVAWRVAPLDKEAEVIRAMLFCED